MAAKSKAEKGGRKGFFVELPEEMLAEWRDFCDRYPQISLTQQVQWAMRRHMDSPPEVRAPALPPAPPPPLAKKRGRPAKKKPGSPS